jgi:high-affinity nickel-transport protein
MIFADTYKSFVMFRKNKVSAYNNDMGNFIEQQGIMAKIFKPALRLVTKSWHMYLVGFLFGLGFDTATEISLLGISASQAVQGLPIWIIMVFPALFMAGMCLIDTTDGVLMLGMYGWAFVDPAKKLFYNMTITFISFLVAFFIGGIEGLCVIAEKFNLQNGFWKYVTNLNENMGNMGYYIIGMFIVSWILSFLIYKAIGLGRECGRG